MTISKSKKKENKEMSSANQDLEENGQEMVQKIEKSDKKRENGDKKQDNEEKREENEDKKQKNVDKKKDLSGSGKEEVKIGEDEKNKESKKRKLGTFVQAEVVECVGKVCKALNETNYHLMDLIYYEIGEESFMDIYEKTLEIEKGEGILTTDKERRKTPGGVFLHLVGEKLGKQNFNALCKRNLKERKKQKLQKDLNS